MSWIDKAGAKAGATIIKLPGKLGEVARKAKDAPGRPLPADERELADGRAFEAKAAPKAATVVAAPAPATEPAPVIVYHMDKTRRDASRIVDILEANGIPHKVTNIQEDPAAQYAVRRDSNGLKLPVVFIAGECLG